MTKYLPKLSPEILTAAVIFVCGAVVLSLYRLGPHAAHMALHIALMNVVAPVIASLFGPAIVPFAGRSGPMWLAGAVQVALLWMWHIPAMQAVVMHNTALAFVMQGSLLIAALWFWSSVLSLEGTKRWHAVPALLLTGKLVCLLSALMVFSPRALYDLHAHHHAAVPALDDQQLAGLLMITACPLSYIVVGVIMVARLLGDLQRRPAAR